MKKPWYKSKSVWGAIIAGIGGIVTAIGGHYGLDLSWVPEVFTYIGASLFGIGIRDALK
jgi:Mg2+ and Co2+ transporter CorA